MSAARSKRSVPVIAREISALFAELATTLEERGATPLVAGQGAEVARPRRRAVRRPAGENDDLTSAAARRFLGRYCVESSR